MSSAYDLRSIAVDSAIDSYHQPYLIFTVTLAHPHMLNSPFQGLIYINDATGVGNSHNKYVVFSTFVQSNDSTLVINTLNLPLSQYDASLKKATNLYLTVAIDNPLGLAYRDENGNYVHSSAAAPAPEVIINNASHKF